jgi:transcription elongation factor GreA
MNHPMTVYGKDLIEKELEDLVKNDRENIKKAIAEARELGDLKENAEYHAAKEKQSMIEGRIAELQGKLAKAQVINVSEIDTEKIAFGATVTVFDQEKDESITYQIVGEDEAKLDDKKISYLSPLAKSLIGKEEGDEVIVHAPKGKIVFEVEAISYES